MSMRAFSLRGIAFRRMDDETLLDAARDGQEMAFAELYRRYNRLVYGYCLARLMDPQAAEDVAQDTFMRINRSRSSESIHSARAWVFTVARSAVVDHVRRQKRLPSSVPVDDDFEIAAFGSDAGDTMMRREDAKQVFLALARLRPRYRSALVLREMHGLSSAEIGETMNLKVGAVDTLVCRARDAFGREYAALSDLPTDCRKAVEYLYRERGTGIDAQELRWLDDHVSSCPRCARERSLASDPKRLAVLLPLMSIRPEGIGIVQRALEVLGSAPASFEALGLMAAKVAAVAVATSVAVSPLAGRMQRRAEFSSPQGSVAESIAMPDPAGTVSVADVTEPAATPRATPSRVTSPVAGASAEPVGAVSIVEVEPDVPGDSEEPVGDIGSGETTVPVEAAETTDGVPAPEKPEVAPDEPAAPVDEPADAGFTLPDAEPDAGL